MDVSSSLIQITKWFIRDRNRNINIHIFPKSKNTLNLWQVIIEVEWDQKKLIGSSGGSKSLFEAYLKALSELGENIILDSSALMSRCGIAGGLFESQAIIRAKAELLERDSFFYHYRNKVPFYDTFTLFKDGIELCIFQLQSSDPHFYSYLATDKDCTLGKSSCLLFGTSAHPDKNVAIEKAIQEYSAIRLNHILQPERCESLFKNPDKIATIMDKHHIASRDPRNLNRFQNLCQTSKNMGNRKQIDPKNWETQKLKSPFRLLKFIRVDHPDLIKMTFGIPEPGEDKLFHPFW